MEKIISITMKELSRYEILQKLIKKEMNGTEAAKLLCLSVRQTRRLKKKASEGIQGIIHKNRGRESNRKISPDKEKRAVSLIKELYNDFKPTFAMEKLEAEHHIKLSREKVRQIMIKNGIWKPKQKKKNKEHREWRQRKESFGEMEQFDGCYHKWFENRAPECCLLASIDDAEGKITKAKFGSNEGINSVYNFWKEYIEKNGKPLSIYLDKFSTYKINHKAAEDNSELMTQFEKAAKELDIKLITANSPEAKGRVERLFNTLQDRLVKEMRLRNISDKETANAFLENEFVPWFNKKFAVLPKKANDLHRKPNEEEFKNLDSIFSVKSKRIINNDFTIRFKNKWYQLQETQKCLVLKKDEALIEERLDNSVWIKLKGKYLNYIILPERPPKVDIKLPALTRVKSSWIPPVNHPWRKQTQAILKQKVALLT